MGESHTELGATLQAVRRLTPPGTERKRRGSNEQALLKELQYELKREMKRLAPRTLANSVFNITVLRAADKATYSKAVLAIARLCASLSNA
jgi:hypothetical protein